MVAVEAEARVVRDDLVGVEVNMEGGEDAPSVSDVSQRITSLQIVQMQKYTLLKKLTLQFALPCI